MVCISYVIVKRITFMINYSEFNGKEVILAKMERKQIPLDLGHCAALPVSQAPMYTKSLLAVLPLT